MEQEEFELSRSEKAVVAGLVLVYLAWKVYKFHLIEIYGAFSSQVFGASLMAGVGIVALGWAAFSTLHWCQRRSAGQR